MMYDYLMSSPSLKGFVLSFFFFMTTTNQSADLVANIFSAVKSLNCVSALTLVSEPRFRRLLSLVEDHVDTVRVKYPTGFGGFMNLSDFYQEYNQQEERKETYAVKVPISKIFYQQALVRSVRPENCINNFELYNYTVDFCESEIPVVFYNEVSGEFTLVKKQHTTAQIAAISNATGEDIEVYCRVIAFDSSVSKDNRNWEASKIFYKEVEGINKTKDWEALPHQVACGDQAAINAMEFYKSIAGFTWQPIEFPFHLVKNPQFTCTKVSQMKQLVSYAINDGELDSLREIVQTICNSVEWDNEKPAKEISAYLLRGLYNFEKRLHPLLDDARVAFNMNDHIEEHFGFYNYRINSYLGSTTIDKKPWQHMVKVASRVNDYLIRNRQRKTAFFSLRSKKFVSEVEKLANPTSKSSVDTMTIEKYIQIHCN